MSPIHPLYLEHQLKRCTRPNAHLFVRPDWRRYVQPGSELAAYYESIELKYSPDQPRVPAGSSEGGRWAGNTGDDGAGTQGGMDNDGPTPDLSTSTSDNATQIAQSGVGVLLGQQIIHPSNGGGKNCYYRFSYGIVPWRMSSFYMACPPTLPWPAATHSPILR